jgi:hypothetical protein
MCREKRSLLFDSESADKRNFPVYERVAGSRELA